MIKLLSLLLCLVSVQAYALPPVATSVRTVYSSTNVGTTSPVTLVSSLTQPSNKVAIFDSSGQTMELIVTFAGSVSYIIIPPGGGYFPVGISAGALIQILALSSTASTGENDVSFLF